ncbi:MAG: outer membrane beta-barrel family protein [Bacteroidota bacterium]
MKFKLLLLILIFTLSSSLKAQPPGQGSGMMPQGFGSVSGMIVEQSSGQIIEYANIVLFRVKDSTMVTGGITDGKGKFRIEKVPFGMYYAGITFIGFNTKKVSNVKVNPKTPDVDMGKLELESASTGLQSVTITGQKSTMEFTLDKKVVNVEKDITSMGGTALDVLKNIPSVTVDIDNTLSLRGSGNVTVLIDGRPSGITGTNLEQIAASSIETVELITNPSARYNPEGMSGIINIKLRKKKDLGLNGIVTLNAGTGDKYNGSVNLNYNVKKFNFFVSDDLRFDHRTGYGKMTRSTFYNDSTSVTKQNSTNWRNGNSNGFKLGMDVAISPTQNLTLSYYRNKGNTTSEDNEHNDYYSPPDTLAYTYNVQQKEKQLDNNNDYTLAYKKTFETKGEELTLDVVYSKSPEDEKADINRTYQELTVVPPLNGRDSTDTKNNRSNLNIQLNYVHPFTKDLKLEGGYQGIIRSTDDNYAYYNYDSDLGMMKPDSGMSNHFKYTENIQAAYAILGHTLGKFSYQAGIRYEMVNTKSEQKTQDLVFDRKYGKAYPSVHVNYKLPLEQEVQLSYSKRVNRPNMWSLNPFVETSTPGVIRYGNPNLSPEFINSYELGYSKYWKKGMTNGTVFYRKIDDVIKRYTFLDTNGILNMTSKNLTYGLSYGVEVLFDREILKWWKLNISGSYFKSEVKGNDNTTTDLTNSNYSWNMRLNSNMTLPKKIMFQLTANYRGPQVNLQGTMDPVYSMDIAFRKDFLHDKASVSFRLSDVFKTNKFGNHSSGPGFSADMERWRESRVAYLGFTYKFGKNQLIQKRGKKDNSGGEGGGEDF